MFGKSAIIYSVLCCFMALITASLGETDNSTVCPESLELQQMRKYMEISDELTGSLSSYNKTIVKREANAEASLGRFNPDGWPGHDFFKKPRYEVAGPVEIRQTINNIQVAESVQIATYRYPIILAAAIGPYIFSCRQDNGFLVVRTQTATPNVFIVNQYNNLEFVYHPIPGLWWFVKCIHFENGQHALDVTGVQKSGGDSGINPNALKSLVG